MGSSCSNAWNTKGDILLKYGIPWGAVRKGVLHYLDNILTITKLTLSGVTYNIGKQASDGLVVVGNGYSSVTFFLPDNREPMTKEDGSSMSLYDYLTMLGNTDYASIPAWDYFAAFVHAIMSQLLDNSNPDINIDVTNIAYTFSQIKPEGVEVLSFTGAGDFTKITTASEFFNTIYENLDSASAAKAKASPLSDWMEEDGAVSGRLSITIGDGLAFPLCIGRK